MKIKIAITGIILVLVMMFVAACEADTEAEIEYTDVVYSEDGSQVTLYLDGVGVPVTPAQRAINKDMAMMAYDFFEVIFVGTDATAANISRTSWELGERAGISAVPRPFNYAYGAAKTTGIAVMFVGRKDTKTLFGVGFITRSSPFVTDDATVSPWATVTVNSSTTSVTFSINALQTGLLVNNEVADNGNATQETNEVLGVMADSFKFATAPTTNPASPYPARNATYTSRGEIAPTLAPGVLYPKYILSTTEQNGKIVNATYDFSYASSVLVPTAFIKVINDTANSVVPIIQKRVPRFMSGGRYLEMAERWSTGTKVTFTGGTYVANNASFVPSIPISFTMQGTGVFSFYIQIPVYMLTTTAATFTGGGNKDFERWYIRTGVGGDLYSLDNGIDNGGCVLLQVGGTASSSSWLEIDWTWL